jgi:hypothetical protein
MWQSVKLLSRGSLRAEFAVRLDLRLGIASWGVDRAWREGLEPLVTVHRIDLVGGHAVSGPVSWFTR